METGADKGAFFIFGLLHSSLFRLHRQQKEGNMDEENQVATGEEQSAEQTPQGVDPETPQGEESEQIDWKATTRKWERHAKDNAKGKAEAEKAAAKAAEEVEALRQENEKARAELEQLRAKQVRLDLVSKTAQEVGVDVGILGRMVGDTDEEVRANAELLAAAFKARPAYPNVTDAGATSQANTMTRETILAEKDPARKVRLIAENKELFR